ncbi:MAG: L,D-transpeptidase [Desulfomonilaceae bacterium]
MNTFVTDRILSFGDPSEIVDQRRTDGQSHLYKWGNDIGHSALTPSTLTRVHEIDRSVRSPMKKTSANKSKTENLSSHDALKSGSVPEEKVKMASTGPGPNTPRSEYSASRDSADHLKEVGKKVEDPVYLYSNFRIEVEKARYTVKLYGIDDEGNKTELFSCKAGLGSSEYPTPRGSFYITRIFDDKPLWIPPRDRDWAYGQAPSHSVYGGRMMPFFRKEQIGPPPKSDDASCELDIVAPGMKLVDTGTYRIHGTDSPWSVGSAQSHGCVRLLNSSVAKLADTLKMYVGTTTRGQSPNGVYINLARPVKLVLY